MQTIVLNYLRDKISVFIHLIEWLFVICYLLLVNAYWLDDYMLSLRLTIFIRDRKIKRLKNRKA